MRENGKSKRESKDWESKRMKRGNEVRRRMNARRCSLAEIGEIRTNGRENEVPLYCSEQPSRSKPSSSLLDNRDDSG